MAYLVIASGVAMTATRLIDLTALRIDHASCLMNLHEPDQAARMLLLQLSDVAAACAVMTVRLPPDWLAHAFHTPVGSLAWSTIMSIGTAACGANARATARSLWVRSGIGNVSPLLSGNRHSADLRRRIEPHRAEQATASFRRSSWSAVSSRAPA
jgi:hypothetical protein